MGEKFTYHLRMLAATLITLSGIGHIAALWHRELTEAALGDALLGAVYLIIGLGLYGISRFTLFVAILVPAAASTYMLSTFPDGGLFYDARLLIDTVVIFASAVVLWQVRHRPSV